MISIFMHFVVNKGYFCFTLLGAGVLLDPNLKVQPPPLIFTLTTGGDIISTVCVIIISVIDCISMYKYTILQYRPRAFVPMISWTSAVVSVIGIRCGWTNDIIADDCITVLMPYSSRQRYLGVRRIGEFQHHR